MSKKETQKPAYVIPETKEQAKSLNITDKVFETRLNKIISTSKTLREDIHILAMECLTRAYGQDNWDIMTKLLNAVNNCHSEAAGKQLKTWFMTYSPTRYVKNKDKKHVFRKDTSENANDFDFVGAFENPFYTIVLYTEKEVQELNLTKLKSRLKATITTYEKALSNDNDPTQPKISSEDRQKVYIMLNQLRELYDQDIAI